MARKPIPRGRIIVGALLVALAVASWRTFSLEGEKHRLEGSYERARAQLVRLLDEHGLLEEELTGAVDEAGIVGAEVQTLRREMARLQKRLDETMVDLTALQAEREALVQENITLAEELEIVTSEKQQLEAKFSSIKELRLALRSVKRKMRDRRWAAWRARVAAQKTKDERLLAEGNRGFIVRDGQATLGVGTKLHVRVLEPQSP